MNSWKVGAAGGMTAAVHDVQHGDGQRGGAYAAKVAVERQAKTIGGGVSQRQRDAQNCVGPQRALIRRSVQRQEPRVHGGLVDRIFAFDLKGNHVVDVFDGS